MTTSALFRDQSSATLDETVLTERRRQCARELDSVHGEILKSLRSGCAPPRFDTEKKLLLAIEAAQRILQAGYIR